LPGFSCGRFRRPGAVIVWSSGAAGRWAQNAMALAGAAVLVCACRAEGAVAGSGRAPEVQAVPGETAALRVVSLHDVTTEIVVALGAVHTLVGVGGAVELPAPAQRAVAGVPRVEGAESIAAVRPTLLLGTDVVAERSPELVAFLRGRGVQVWLAAPARLDDVFAMVADLAALLRRVDRGRALVGDLRARAASVSRHGKAEPVPVFVYDCCDPAFTAAGKTVITDVIARAGGRNVFADLNADWTKVSWEQVIARRPRLVLIHAYDYQGQGDVAAKRKQLRAIRALAHLPTTVLPLGLSLGGIRSLDALEHLAPVIARMEER
jgi:iron complex transport system substrate-binding protein